MVYWNASLPSPRASARKPCPLLQRPGRPPPPGPEDLGQDRGYLQLAQPNKPAHRLPGAKLRIGQVHAMQDDSWQPTFAWLRVLKDPAQDQSAGRMLPAIRAPRQVSSASRLGIRSSMPSDLALRVSARMQKLHALLSRKGPLCRRASCGWEIGLFISWPRRT